MVCDISEEKGLDMNSMPIQKEMLYSTVSDIEFISDGKEWLESILNGYFEKIKDAGVQYRPEIKKLIDYIHENYPEDITLSWASNYVNISENHLSSLFKKETGKNFIKYLEECRIDKAAILYVKPIYQAMKLQLELDMIILTISEECSRKLQVKVQGNIEGL